MSNALMTYLRLAWDATLDFSAAYTVAQITDAFFDSSWMKGSNLVTNTPSDPETNIFSLAIRLWLQLMATTLVGSEIRSLIFPEDKLDGFSLILFIFGLVQQPKFLEKLTDLIKAVKGKVNGTGDSKPGVNPTNMPSVNSKKIPDN